ncbi:ABC transporter substrate-binding protein [Chloroflexota bacterium]
MKIAIGTYGVTKALKDGRVLSNRLELEHIQVDPITLALRRMVRGLEYDISEMAFTTYLCARAFNKPFTAIPVFVFRNFAHGAMVYNVKSGIKSPKDLEGRRVGVNRGYTVTTGLWARGILQTEYGVDLNKITWVLTGDEHVEEYQLPPNVVPVSQGEDATALLRGKDMEELLLSGKVDAAVGRVSVDSPDVQPLIPDAWNAAVEHFRKTGIYPINHGVVIQNSLLEAEPWVAEEVFNLFKAAKTAYLAHLDADKDLSPQDQAVLPLRDVVGRDPFLYGINANRKTLETIIQFAADQNIIPWKVSVEEVFAPNTLKLE